jgi:hypothetical protein
MVERLKAEGLMGCPFDPAQGKGSPLYVNPVNVLNILIKILADDKCGTARDRLKEARVQSYEPTNRNGIQGPVFGQVSTLRLCSGCPEPAEWAPHDKTQDSGDRVNAAVVSFDRLRTW